MNVSGNYSNYGQVGQQYNQQQQNKAESSNESTGNHAIAFTSVDIVQDGMNFNNMGIRYEKTNLAHKMSIISFEGLAGATVAGHTMGNFHSSVGLGAKANVNIGDYIALYGTATGTANYTLSGSASEEANGSFGVGYRLAYGAEIKAGKAGIYGEMFSEKATNYQATGYAIGAKIYF